MFPTVVVIHPEVDLDEWTPFRPLWFADEMHVRLQRGAVRLFGVTLDAGADNVLPASRAATVPRDDVVQVQIFPFEYFSAVLAGILIAFEDVVTGELDFFLGHAVEKHQNDHAGNPDAEGHSVDAFRMWLSLRDVVPLLEVVRLERAVLGVENDLSVTFEEQS